MVSYFSLSEDFSKVSRLQVLYMLACDNYQRSHKKFALKRFTEEEQNIFPDIAMFRLGLWNPLDAEEVDFPYQKCPTVAHHEGFDMYTAEELDDPEIRERLQVRNQFILCPIISDVPESNLMQWGSFDSLCCMDAPYQSQSQMVKKELKEEEDKRDL